MTAQIKSAWDKTAGYKTKSGAVLLAIYELSKLIAPELMTGNVDLIISRSINLLIITGGADWIYRNRKEIVNWCKNLFNNKK